jgi:hypothetical protein
MDRDKERQEISLIGRFLSLDALLVVMGLLSLVTGIAARDTVRLLCGLLILVSLIGMILLRKRKTGDKPSGRNRNKGEQE